MKAGDEQFHEAMLHIKETFFFLSLQGYRSVNNATEFERIFPTDSRNVW